jgi:hypothetical protein
MLQGTDRISRATPADPDAAGLAMTALTGPSLTPLRTDEAAALPSPAVMLSAPLNRYYGRLRRPPGQPSTSRATGYGTPRSGDNSRRSPDRGGSPQFPPPPSMRSAPHTPGSSSRLRLQALHRFRGLRPDFERLGTPLLAPEDG